MARELCADVRPPGGERSRWKGALWVRVEGGESGLRGKAPASAIEEAPGDWRILVENPLGGVEAEIRLDRSHLAVRRMDARSGALRVVEQANQRWRNVPLLWAVRLLEGSTPCPEPRDGAWRWELDAEHAWLVRNEWRAAIEIDARGAVSSRRIELRPEGRPGVSARALSDEFAGQRWTHWKAEGAEGSLEIKWREARSPR